MDGVLVQSLFMLKDSALRRLASPRHPDGPFAALRAAINPHQAVLHYVFDANIRRLARLTLPDQDREAWLHHEYTPVTDFVRAPATLFPALEWRNEADTHRILLYWFAGPVPTFQAATLRDLMTLFPRQDDADDDDADAARDLACTAPERLMVLHLIRFVPPAPPSSMRASGAPIGDDVRRLVKTCIVFPTAMRVDLRLGYGFHHTCLLCHRLVTGRTRCARCSRAMYCDRECQALHWRWHRPTCTPALGVKGEAVLGRIEAPFTELASVLAAAEVYAVRMRIDNDVDDDAGAVRVTLAPPAAEERARLHRALAVSAFDHRRALFPPYAFAPFLHAQDRGRRRPDDGDDDDEAAGTLVVFAYWFAGTPPPSLSSDDEFKACAHRASEAEDEDGRRLLVAQRTPVLLLLRLAHGDDPMSVQARRAALALIRATSERLNVRRLCGLDRRCAYCGLWTTRRHRCGRCRTAVYCDRECQLADWPMHRLRCVL